MEGKTNYETQKEYPSPPKYNTQKYKMATLQ